MSETPCPREGQLEIGIPADPELTAAGWVRRYLADTIRAEEAINLYGELGYEVMAKKLTRDDLGANCEGCPVEVCEAYVMIYTRKEET